MLHSDASETVRASTRQRAAPSTLAPLSNLILPLSKDVFFSGNVIPWSTGMSSLKNIRSNEWNRLTGIPAIITGSPLAFIPGNFDLVIPKTTQRVCSVAGRNRQSSRVPPILAQSGYRVNRATRKIGSLYNKHGDCASSQSKTHQEQCILKSSLAAGPNLCVAL